MSTYSCLMNTETVRSIIIGCVLLVVLMEINGSDPSWLIQLIPGIALTLVAVWFASGVADAILN